LEKTNDQLQMTNKFFFPGKISHAYLQNHDLKQGGNASEEENRGYKRSMVVTSESQARTQRCFQGLKF
jgi:hypothetical protein